MLDPQVRRRKAERAAARVAGDDDSLDLERAAEQRCGRAHVAGGGEPPDLRRRDAGDDRHDPRRRARAARSSARSPLRAAAEAERLAGARPPRRRSRARRSRANSSGSRPATSGVNSTTSVSSTPSSASSSSRRSSVDEQLDLVAEHLARVRVERDDRRRQARVERRCRRPPDGRRGRRRRCRSRPRAAGARARPVRARRSRRLRVVRPRHRSPSRPRASAGSTCRRPSPPAASASNASTCALQPVRDPVERLRRQPGSASDTGSSRSGSASSTRNGPTAVRRSVVQWPPSAVAIDRTYVPEPTWSSSWTASPVYVMTSSA